MSSRPEFHALRVEVFRGQIWVKLVRESRSDPPVERFSERLSPHQARLAAATLLAAAETVEGPPPPRSR